MSWEKIIKRDCNEILQRLTDEFRSRELSLTSDKPKLYDTKSRTKKMIVYDDDFESDAGVGESMIHIYSSIPENLACIIIDSIESGKEPDMEKWTDWDIDFNYVTNNHNVFMEYLIVKRNSKIIIHISHKVIGDSTSNYNEMEKGWW